MVTNYFTDCDGNYCIVNGRSIRQIPYLYCNANREFERNEQGDAEYALGCPLHLPKGEQKGKRSLRS